MLCFAEFPTYVAENSAHAGSVILDSVLSLDSGFIDDNSASHVPFCDLCTLLQSNTRVTKMLHLLAEEIHTQIRNFVWDSRFTHVLQRIVGTNFLIITQAAQASAVRWEKFTSPYFYSVTLVIWPLTLMKRTHFSELSISRFSTFIRKALMYLENLEMNNSLKSIFAWKHLQHGGSNGVSNTSQKVLSLFKEPKQ